MNVITIPLKAFLLYKCCLIIDSQSHGFGDYIRVAFYGDKVANIIWREKTLVTIIEDKEIREGYQKYFEYLWKNTKI